MIYFSKKENEIEKYHVNFDKKEIEKLKRIIIDNCSFIEHIEYEGDYSPRFNNRIIRNYISYPTGKRKEYFEETREIDFHSYDEYKPPYLVELINQLLNDNSEVIDEILNYDTSSKNNIDEKINLINQQFNEIDPDNINKKKEKLVELENLVNSKEFNKGQQNIDLYYDKLMSLIKFELVDTITINELNNVASFLEINESTNKSFIKLLRKK